MLSHYDAEAARVAHRSVNACLCPLYAIEGMHVVTVEGKHAVACWHCCRKSASTRAARTAEPATLPVSQALATCAAGCTQSRRCWRQAMARSAASARLGSSCPCIPSSGGGRWQHMVTWHGPPPDARTALLKSVGAVKLRLHLLLVLQVM